MLYHYQRVLSFGTKFDYFLIGLCVLTAVGAGVAMPLMFVGMFRDILYTHYRAPLNPQCLQYWVISWVISQGTSPKALV